MHAVTLKGVVYVYSPLIKRGCERVYQNPHHYFSAGERKRGDEKWQTTRTMQL